MIVCPVEEILEITWKILDIWLSGCLLKKTRVWPLNVQFCQLSHFVSIGRTSISCQFLAHIIDHQMSNTAVNRKRLPLNCERASNYNPCITVLTPKFQFVFFCAFTFVPFLVSHLLTSCGLEKLRQMMKGEPSITTLRDWSEKRGWRALRHKNLCAESFCVLG